MIAIYLNAGHDTNGNPRRGWVITEDNGDSIDYVDEGYRGGSALKVAGYEGIPVTGEIPTTASFIRDLKRQMKDAPRPKR